MARPANSLTSADEIALSGPSDLPDPAFHAYRRDLADRALAARIISSHYVEPVEVEVVNATTLRSEPRENAEMLADLANGDRFRLLESKLGWAWGYGGAEGRVGYVKVEALRLD